MMKPASCLVALFTTLVSSAATAVVTTQALPTGPSPVAAAIDSVTGRVFVANVGSGRYGNGMSYTVIEPDGRSTTFPDDQTPVAVAVSASLRKVVFSNGGFSGSSATILDADTLAKTRVATGNGPSRAIIVDASATAYLVGRAFNGTKGPGSLTEIDLRTGTSLIVDVPGYSTEHLAVVASLGRAFIAGNGVPGGIALASTAWIQAYDLNTHALAGPAVRLPGRQVEALFAAADGSRLYAIAHLDAFDTRFDRPVPSLRSAIFVIDPATLGVVATYPLPEVALGPIVIPFTLILDERFAQFIGATVFDAATNSLFTLEWFNKRLLRIDLATGAVSQASLEGYAHALELNPATNTLLVTFVDGGYLGVFNRDLARLDTIPLGTPTPRAESLGLYAIVANPANGDVYATYPKDNAIVRVSAPRAGEAQSVVNLTDLWSNPAEPGWGLFLDHQGLTLFGTLFTNDANGDGLWLVMPEARRQPDGAFTGLLYRTSGPASQALANVSAVGTMRFSLDANGNATLQYTVGSAGVTKSVRRQLFAAAPRHCAWTPSPVDASAPDTNFTSLWYNPAEPGWGLSLSQQGDTLFGVLYAYNSQDRAEWTVMSNGKRQADGSFAGELHRARGGRLENAGALSVQFSSAARGVMHSVVDGVSQWKNISRQLFSAPTTACNN